MSTATDEIMQLCEALPPEKRAEVADFAKFLLSRSDDEAWEEILRDSRPRPRLETFLRESVTEGETALDATRL